MHQSTHQGALFLTVAVDRLKSGLVDLEKRLSNSRGLEKRSFYIVLYSTGLAFVLTEIALLYIMFRSRRNEESVSADRPRAWEALWSAIPAIILLILVLVI